MPVIANAIAIKTPYSSGGGAAAPLLEDTFTEGADTDLTAHTPDVNNTGNSWANAGAKNPLEVEAAGDYARSKNVSGFTFGYGVINIGRPDAVATAIFAPYTNAFYMHLALNADAGYDNGWLFRWNAAGGVQIAQRVANTDTVRASQAVAATTSERTVIMTRTAASIAIDFNNGEASLSYNSATSYGNYAGLGLERKDSGLHYCTYLLIEEP